MDQRSLPDPARCRRSTPIYLLALAASGLLGCTSASPAPERVLAQLGVCPDGMETGADCELGADRTCASDDGQRFCWCEPQPDGTTAMQCEGVEPPPDAEQCSVERLSRCLEGGRTECTSPNGGHCLCTSTPGGGLELHCTPPSDECDGRTPEEDCQFHYERCLDEGAPPEHCRQILLACSDDEDPAPEPDDRECDREFAECLDAGIDPDRCQLRLESCIGEPAPPPDGEGCIEEYEQCLDAGIDPDRCQLRLQECGDDREPPPPPDQEACFEEYERCLTEGIDPDRCEQFLQECGGDGEPPPPTDEEACFAEFEECLNAGIEPDRCQQRLESCVGEPPPPEPSDPSDVPECSDEGVIFQCQTEGRAVCTRSDRLCECRADDDESVSIVCEP